MSTLPFWPRYLTRTLAAAYLGVSVDVFADEVRSGIWPPPRLRGGKGGRHTWDRKLLDLAADKASGILSYCETRTETPAKDPGEDMWMARIAGLGKRAP